jgi:hypothetical protein
MSKIIAAEDILADARDCIECLNMAASDLEEVDPLQTVARIANMKIDEAIALLDEYRNAGDAEGRSPPPAELSAKPASRTARTKRTGK